VKSRVETVREYLSAAVFGEPQRVRAHYALAGSRLFGDVRAEVQVHTELLWYLEACEAFGWKLTLGSAASWVVHCEDDRCGVCGGNLPSKEAKWASLTGLQLRLCVRHRIELHQKLRERKNSA
jgi:hypothetical protein